MTRSTAQSILLFLLAGVLEIGGGYLVWLWLRDGRGWLLGALGGLVLFLYGVIPTLQPAHFGRVYAAYGGVFVVLSLLWGWWADGIRPDRPDVVGALICLAGVAVIMYWPRAAPLSPDGAAIPAAPRRETPASPPGPSSSATPGRPPLAP
jgi:small multidrug resistance family-3 protein